METDLAKEAVTVERAASLLDRIVEKQALDATRYKPVMSVDESIERYRAIEKFMRECMAEGIDYGKPPGFPKDAKPFLYKPGAQKLCAFFGYVPHYTEVEVIEDWSGKEHDGEPLFYYRYSCVLSKNRDAVGEGIGSCNTWETKYRYRNAGRACPQCGAEAIIKGKAEYGGGFICFAKKGGCGAKFADDDAEILSQEVGKVANPDIADTINTVQKQAEKRAYVEATLSATGASAFFSQDEDVVTPPKPAAASAPPAATSRAPSRRSEPAAPADERLQFLLNRAKQSAGDAEAVLSDLVRDLDELKGSATADTAWAHAIKTHGDPAKKPSAIDPVIRTLYHAIAAATFGADETKP